MFALIHIFQQRTLDSRARHGRPGSRSFAAPKQAGVCSCSSDEQPVQASGRSTAKLSRRDALLGAVVTLSGAALAGSRAGPAWAAEVDGDKCGSCVAELPASEHGEAKHMTDERPFNTYPQGCLGGCCRSFRKGYPEECASNATLIPSLHLVCVLP